LLVIVRHFCQLMLGDGHKNQNSHQFGEQ